MRILKCENCDLRTKLAIATKALEFYSHPNRACSIDGETELHWETESKWFNGVHKPFGTSAREALEKLKD